MVAIFLSDTNFSGEIFPTNVQEFVKLSSSEIICKILLVIFISATLITTFFQYLYSYPIIPDLICISHTHKLANEMQKITPRSSKISLTFPKQESELIKPKKKKKVELELLLQ